MELLKVKEKFQEAIELLGNAIQENNLKIVSRINAQENLAKANLKIKGNYIFEVFRPDLAYKLFNLDIRAGIVPPLRIYVFEKGDETFVEYWKPSEILNKWGAEEIGRELDETFYKIMKRLSVIERESLSL
ncbi:DUF302 domain-containing protein [Sulfuracidifex tepidarius]|nr:DUF302 domain-containing protein [Sulfuracidifex tepidarius]